jgi:hypothetical protein
MGDPEKMPVTRTDRSGVVVAGTSVLGGLGVSALWMVFHRGEWVYAAGGRDASWEIIKRAILLGAVASIAVAFVLTRVLGGPEGDDPDGR